MFVLGSPGEQVDWSPVVMNRPSDYISRHSDTKIHQLQIVIPTSYFLCLHFLLNPSDLKKFPEKKRDPLWFTQILVQGPTGPSFQLLQRRSSRRSSRSSSRRSSRRRSRRSSRRISRRRSRTEQNAVQRAERCKFGPQNAENAVKGSKTLKQCIMLSTGISVIHNNTIQYSIIQYSTVLYSIL